MPVPERKLNGALIGCGYVAQFHLQAWAKVPGIRLAALCDVRPERLETSRALAPRAQTFQDAEAMFAATRLDFVEICTPPESHRPLVELAAAHGVHVLCQKPAAADRAELCAMIAACDRAGVRLMIHENWRFRPWYRFLRAEVDAGSIGRPIRIRIAHRDTRALRPDGFADQPFLAERPQLILLEMGCHLVDTARFLCGDVASVSAILGQFGPGHPGEDVATLLLQFQNGALGLLDLSWCAPPDLARPEWALNETVIEGNAGALLVQTDGSLLWKGLSGEIRHQPVPRPPGDEVYVAGYLETQKHFIAGLIQSQPHETDGRDTLKTMDVVWAGYKSAREGRNIRLGEDNAPR